MSSFGFTLAEDMGGKWVDVGGGPGLGGDVELVRALHRGQGVRRRGGLIQSEG